MTNNSDALIGDCREAAATVNHLRSRLDNVWLDDSRDSLEDAALCHDLALQLAVAIGDYLLALSRLNPEPRTP